ncbi:MAG: ABC transporter ATP-binding protein [Pelagibacterium sp.]|jgi:peptide/nickel transport system ATP-binding protein|uniref:ABC transporter ATP-binding protein n=1 Tax=Pelagibacterium sp. TaxID=1967288 RepID=UPI0032F04048|tara:strand:- start:4037 stop:4834 length:798 start_codon:yes stop_codon:yes gene_type:complete
MSALVSVRDLQVDYLTGKGLFTAVKGVDFDIGQGEVMGLAGESGCGKSTIAFSLMRLHRPPAIISRGTIIINGEDVLAMPLAKLEKWRWSSVSMVFQSAMNSLNPVLTLFEQFRDMLARHTGLSKPEIRARAEELLKLVGISAARLDDYPHQLSGGMRQRVVLAMALALNPKLIVMDEPTTALDVVVQREILQEIMALKAQFGFSILFITHDLALMSQFADRIAVMLEGQIVEHASTASVVSDPQHEYTRKLWDAMPKIAVREAS